MKVQSLELRGTHPYSFRTGKWALVIGFVTAEPDGLTPRHCYEVRYPDGVVDYVAVEGSPFELRPALGAEA